MTQARTALLARRELRKNVDAVVRSIDIQDFVGNEVNKIEAIRLEEAKVSMLYWLDTYYSYDMQKLLLKVTQR